VRCHRRSRLWSDRESGITLVELAVAMGGLALVSTTMLSVFVGTTRVDQVQAADDAAQEAVRDARSRLAKDVREARRFAAIGQTSFTVWLDDDWDGLMPAGELVTWSISEAGGLVRAVGGAAGRLEAAGVSRANSRFSYDSAVAAQVTRSFLHLVIGVAGPEAAYRTLDFEVAMRNVP